LPRIVCVDHANPTRHEHIVSVGLSSDSKAAEASSQETVAEVRAAIRAGNRYYTVGLRSGKTAEVEAFDCACGYKTIRSGADAVTDNNLDGGIRECKWTRT
jgi:Protein of unknown function (DUF3892)